MSWNEIHGHEQIADTFRRWAENDRLSGAYLFVGPDGIGKRMVAYELARSLLCEQTDSSLDPCGVCSACQQVTATTHPDFLVVSRPPDKNFIPVHLLIGDDEHRMREGLCHDIALKPFRGGRKVALIDDADFLNQEGANCLLKTLEEPPPQCIIILIGTSEHRQLPTIRSRCQIVRFRRLSDAIVKTILLEKQLLQDDGQVEFLSQACDGSVELALQLAEPDVRDFRKDWLARLASGDPGGGGFAESINSFVDSAGKEGAAKRDRLRLVSHFALQFYRNLMLNLSGAAGDGDAEMLEAVRASLDDRKGNAESIADCLQRCLDARYHIAANANQHTLIECWLSDLARLSRGELVEDFQ